MLALLALATVDPKEHHQQQQLAHTPHHGPDGHVRCGTIIPDVEELGVHGRHLAKTDCDMSRTNPLPAYSPANGPIYRIDTVVHVITDGAAGAISRSCVESGMDWLNRDFRARTGTKASGSVDTRIEFVLSEVRYHDNGAWMDQAHGSAGGFWSAADVHNRMNIFVKTPPGAYSDRPTWRSTREAASMGLRLALPSGAPVPLLAPTTKVPLQRTR